MGTRPLDNSYMDLYGGSKLRITVPLSDPVGPQARVESSQEQDQITVHTDSGVGYEQCRYAVDGRRKGKVRLIFQGSEITRENHTTAETKEPMLPFPLPRSREYIRLVYLVRKSQADHNMAILGAKRRNVLDAFTEKLEKNPGLCSKDKKVFCTFVPSGFAVRPED